MSSEYGKLLKMNIFPRVPLALWIQKWEINGSDAINNMYIVLHTSAVSFGEEELRRTFEICKEKFEKSNWLIAEDTYYELVFMRKYSHFSYLRAAAEYILTHSIRVSWSYSYLNDYSRKSWNTTKDFYSNMLFVFGDCLELEQFIHCAHRQLLRTDKKYYVLCATPEMEGSDGSIVQIALAQERMRHNPFRTMKSNGNTVETIALEETDILFRKEILCGASCRYGEELSFGEFEPVLRKGRLLTGGYGTIYRHAKHPFSYFKIYKNKPTKTLEEKLWRLYALQKECSWYANHFLVGLPSGILYKKEKNNDSLELIGYEMRAFNKVSLYHILDNDQILDSKVAIMNIIALLLDLHSIHVLVRDLCLVNLLSDNAEIAVVDADGFQYMEYMGSGMHKEYKHPDLSKKLSSGEPVGMLYENFAFAVICFNLIFRQNGEHTFLKSHRGKNDEDNEIQFIISKIKNSISSSPSDRQWLKQWNDLIGDMERTFFMDTLDIKKMPGNAEYQSEHIHTLGEWIRLLNIL